MRIIPATPPMYTPAGRVLTWLATILLCAVTFTPLIISAGTLFPFQTGKGIAFRILIEIAGFLYLCLSIIEPHARPKSDRLLWSVLAFGAVLVITMLTGVDPLQSFWGDLERMEGVFGMLHAIALFIIVRGLFRRREDWTRFFSVSLIASLFVALYAFAQVNPAFRFFSVVEAREIQPGSTFGHQSFVATYAIFQIFFGVFVLLLEKKIRWRVFAATAVIINLILLGLTAIRGAQIAMIVSVALGIIVSLLFIVKEIRIRIILTGVLVFSGGLFAAILALKDSPLVNKLPYAFQRMATISPDAAMARTRLISLGVSWEAFKERPWTGWGQEHFARAYNKHFDPEHLTYEQAWFDRAHNKLADIAVQNGVPGLAAFIALFALAFLGLLRRLRDSGEDNRTRWVTLGAIMLGTAYFVQNLFLFDTPTSFMLFFASLGFAGWLIDGSDAKIVLDRPFREMPALGIAIKTILVFAAFLTVGTLIWGNGIPFTTAKLGKESVSAKNPGEALLRYKQALESGGFPTAEVARATMDELINSGKVYRSEWNRVTDAVGAHTEELLAGGYESVPTMVRLGKLYNEQWQRESDLLLKAERVLRRAISLAPNHPDAYYELGVTLLRRGEREQGLALFQSALNLNVRNSRARWTLGLALMSIGRLNEGVLEIEDALVRGYNWDNPADIKNLTVVLTALNRHERLKEIYERVIENHPLNAEYRATLALAYARTGATLKAKEQMLFAVQLDHRYEHQARQFIQNLGL